MRLFVDIDSTLVLWELNCSPRDNELFDFDENSQSDNPYNEKWKPHTKLISQIKKFRQENPNALIVIWSLGGKQYAEIWGRRLLSDITDLVFMDKWGFNLELVQSDSIVIDDSPSDLPRILAPVIHPLKWEF